MLSKNILLSVLAGLVVLLGTSSSGIASTTYAEDDECDGVGTNHGDNSPSEKEFFKAIKTDNVCELTEKIDAMELKGSIEEDGKCDMECFRQLPVWTEKPSELSEDGFIEIKGCMLVRYEDFPKDNGKLHLAEYEIDNCGRGDY